MYRANTKISSLLTAELVNYLYDIDLKWRFFNFSKLEELVKIRFDVVTWWLLYADIVHFFQ